MFFARLNTLSKTLRFRLTVWNVIVIVLTAVATLIGVRQGVRVAIMHEMDQILIEDIYEIEYKLVDTGTTVADIRQAQQAQADVTTQRVLDDLDRKARGHEHHRWFVQLRDEKSNLLWSSEKAPSDVPLERDMPDFQPRTADAFRIVQNGQTTGEFSPLIVRVGASTDFLHRDMKRIDRLVALAATVVLLIAPPIGYWLAGRATRPLGNIIRTASRLRPNHMEERLPIRNTDDELDQLAGTVNRMLDRIADYLSERRDFLANSAHELRSPVAAIRSTAEVALGSKRSKEEYENLLVDVIEECSVLEGLVNQLLLLAETENLSLQSSGKRFDFSSIVERTCDMFQAVAESRDVSLQVQVQPDVFVEGYEYHLRQVLNNLIDNALKFTPAGGEVRVTLRSEDSSVLLTVEDTGIGIPLADLPRIFERFFRGDRSHSRDPEIRGTGLGLSICKVVVEAHRGQIAVENQVGRGTRFSVLLPKARLSRSHQDEVPTADESPTPAA